jgi:hypothetical protein
VHIVPILSHVLDLVLAGLSVVAQLLCISCVPAAVLVHVMYDPLVELSLILVVGLADVQ